MPYEKLSNGDEKYNKDEDDNEIVEGTEYAKDHHGDYFYPKDRDGNEYIDKNIGYITQYVGSYEDIRIKYPISKDGNPIYPKDENNNEFYVKYNNEYHFGQTRSGMECYAKDSSGNEFYPPNNFAAMVNASEVYAKDKNQNTVFPKDEQGNELYLNPINVIEPTTIPTRYAKDKDGNEYYPDLEYYPGYECILHDTYAIKKNGEPFYPVDQYLNEFYIDSRKKSVDEIILSRYAVTYDIRIILPQIGNQPYIKSTLTPPIKDDNVLGKLKRRDNHYYQDYLTNVYLYKNITIQRLRKYYYQKKNTVEDIEVRAPIELITPKSYNNTNNNSMWNDLIVFVLVPLIIYGFFLVYRAIASLKS